MTCWRCLKSPGNYWGLCEPCLRIRNQETAHMEKNTFDEPHYYSAETKIELEGKRPPRRPGEVRPLFQTRAMP